MRTSTTTSASPRRTRWRPSTSASGRSTAPVASIGERAGNAALEEIAVAGTIDGGLQFDVDRAELVPLCEAVLDSLDESVHPNKPVLGSRVFEYESGLQTAAMLSDPAAFEPYAPAEFGSERRLLFGEQTGIGAARALLEWAGLPATDDRCRQLLELLDEPGPVDAEGPAVFIADRFDDWRRPRWHVL